MMPYDPMKEPGPFSGDGCSGPVAPGTGCPHCGVDMLRMRPDGTIPETVASPHPSGDGVCYSCPDCGGKIHENNRCYAFADGVTANA